MTLIELKAYEGLSTLLAEVEDVCGVQDPCAPLPFSGLSGVTSVKIHHPLVTQELLRGQLGVAGCPVLLELTRTFLLAPLP